jgi:tetratricopeptide (TPR) repeat protein
VIRTLLTTIKRWWRPVAVLALVVAAAWGGYVAVNEIRASSWRSAGEQALARSDYSKAEECFETALRLGGADAETYRLLGRAARGQGRFDDAAAFLKTSLRLGGAPEPIALEEQLARAQQGDLGAESILAAYVAGDHPEKRAILDALAHGQLANFRIEQALASTEVLVSHWPEFVEGHVVRARAFYHLRNYGEAAAAYRRAIELRPEHDAARAGLAECLLLQNEPAQAVDQYEVLLERQPDDAAVRLGLARALMQAGRLDDVRQHAKAALDGPRRGEAMLLLGRLELDLENATAAEPWLRQAVELIPYERDVLHAYVRCLAQLNRDDEAKKWQERLLHVDRQRARLRDLVRIINARPGDPAPRHEAGTIFLDVGHDHEGVRWLESALRVDPGHAPSHAALADYYRRQGDTARAAEHEKLAGP